MSKKILVVLMGGAICFLLASTAWADKQISEKDIPKAVMDAIQAAVPGAVFIRGEVDDHHHRQPVYRLMVKDAKGETHLHITQDGRVTRLVRGYHWDKDLPPAELPPAVKTALLRVRPDAEVLEVELGHHHDRLVYEIEIKGGEGEHDDVEIYISAEGEVLKIEDEKHHEHHHD